MIKFNKFMVRAFVGVIIPDDVKNYVESIQKKLKSMPINAKFIERENLHISLSFLGDLEDERIEKVKFQLDEISKSYVKFEITLGGILLIPNENFTRVVALDVKSDDLELIRNEIVKAVGGKSHQAHLTLTRIKSVDDKQKFVKDVTNLICESISFKVDEICLVESMLSKYGPVYKVLHESYLK